ncbi:MAG TPA: UDP-N-acetylmuramoyl-L-alanyl-D-glutamate--2,6-diaminopimelate ligase, partial [Massilibacterium sp.]|nr:UDP-N-acetylmuramoyl-L-alanyl-D-glutamate--2,6-diaminopimelate ligase [Massilibacterium sp.]
RGCDFDIAVFTNLTQDHLDYHQTMEEYEKAKGLLFSQLGNTYGKKRKVAILNADDPVSKTYAKQTTAHILTYGIEHGADIQATNIKMDAKGTTFDVVTPFGNGFVTLKLIGQFNIYNALAAIATTLSYGIPLENILSSLEEMKGVSGRFEVVDEHTPYTVIVDYAHTPDSLLNVLQTTREIVSGRSIVVVGCGGDRDRTKRPKMAQIAVKEADVRIFTSDNPRTEDPVQILKDMESGVEGEDYTTIVNRKEAIFHAVNIAEEGDVIVIAGKGHEDYQIIGSDVIHFDDREVARDAIKEKENGNK